MVLEAALRKYDALDRNDRLGRMLEDAAAAHKGIDETVRNLRSVDAACAARRRQEDDEDDVVVRAYAQEHAHVVNNFFAQDRSSSELLRPVFQALPPIFGALVLERVVPNSAQVTAMLAELVEDMGTGADKFTVALDRMWNHLTRLLPATVEPVPRTHVPDSLEPDHSICFDAGVCLCGEGGAKQLQARHRLFTILKAAFPKDFGERRAHFLKRRMFMRITWHPTFENDEDEVQLADWGLSEPRWFHISRVCLSPYDVCFSEMYETADCDDVFDANPMVGETVLKALNSLANNN